MISHKIFSGYTQPITEHWHDLTALCIYFLKLELFDFYYIVLTKKYGLYMMKNKVN